LLAVIDKRGDVDAPSQRDDNRSKITETLRPRAMARALAASKNDFTSSAATFVFRSDKTFLNDGNTKADKIEMITITTNSSTSDNP